MIEDTNLFLYPRLSNGDARALRNQMLSVQVADLVGWGALSHKSAAPNATGGTPASRGRIEEVQSKVRSLAKEFGFPLRMTVVRQAEFDRMCGTLLFREMGIVPADAGHKEVWTFLSMVVLPEIAPWRFRSPGEDRLFGGVRHTFQRLWWRAWSLGPDLTSMPVDVEPLGEDEYVQIMERTTLAGNRRLAQGVQTVIWESNSSDSGPLRARVLRNLTIRVLAARSNLSFDALDDEQLRGVLRSLKTEALHSVRFESLPSRKAQPL